MTANEQALIAAIRAIVKEQEFLHLTAAVEQAESLCNRLEGTYRVHLEPTGPLKGLPDPDMVPVSEAAKLLFNELPPAMDLPPVKPAKRGPGRWD